MEGVGSRLSRTSSRYNGPAATAAVFSGRVRKWKKKWVHVSSPSTVGSRSSAKSNGRGNATSTTNLYLCRWTPLSPASEEPPPPRRRFRYAPIALLEQREKVGLNKQETEAEVEEETEEFETETPSPKNVELNMNLRMMDTDQTEEPKTGHLDLGVCLKDLNDEDGHVD